VVGASSRLKGKINNVCVQNVFVYGSETWTLNVNDMRILERAEQYHAEIDVWCDIEELRNRKRTAKLMDCLEVLSVEEVVTHGRLRRYGYVERKDKSDWVTQDNAGKYRLRGIKS